MALDPATLNRRIDAAAALVGLSIEKFGEALQEHGVNKSAPKQIKRNAGPTPPAKPVLMNGAIAYAMSKVSGLPTGWFFEEDLAALFATTNDLVSLRRDVDRALAGLRQLGESLVDQGLVPRSELPLLPEPPDATDQPQPQGQTEGGANPRD